MGLEKISVWIISMTILVMYHTTFTGTAEFSKVSDQELQALSEDLLKNDINNCADLITVNLQGQVKQGNKQDSAPFRLLTVNPKALEKPTIQKLRPLFDNYNPDVRDPEDITTQEEYEESSFLDAIFDTPIMAKTHNFLAKKGYVSSDLDTFKEEFYNVWFGMYQKKASEPNSCGFEHVFVGELKGTEVGGFHNWVRFYLEEQQGTANYLGFIEEKAKGTGGYFLKITFKWNQNYKAIGSIFMGASPELEMALYTICFYTKPGGVCRLKLGGNNVSIQTYQHEYAGSIYVATAYPAN
ncbi:endoribonuclease CG2145-like [Ischnura elegans]|uniref:endoribonuclease CG2145-like n=1 Tax=Ischnura elegans TaxID=197161 RepID=UPI001ED8BF01|nr:endoribonuclease CG2145-like [Ischnura elegans]